jgi:hypothetical protein
MGLFIVYDPEIKESAIAAFRFSQGANPNARSGRQAGNKACGPMENLDNGRWKSISF